MNWNDVRVIAVVGASPNPNRPSNAVMRYFIKNGFKVIPITPKYDSIEGVKCYPSLIALPENIAKSIDMVDIFVHAAAVLGIVKQAVELKKMHNSLKLIWMQPGAYNKEAYEFAARNGLEVIANSCAMEMRINDL